MDPQMQIPVSILQQLISVLGSPALQEIKLAYGAKKELDRLRTTIEFINAGLGDAEEQQQKSKLVEKWISRLQDALYEADDLLDEVAFDGLRQMVDPRGRIAREVCDFFSSSNQILFRYKMGHKTKEIREKLDDIKNDMSQFSFLPHNVVDNLGVGYNRRETDSTMLKCNFIGRKKDEKEIINLLLPPLDQNLKHVSVVAIVAMGGLGKTTLAKKVYNDEWVEKQFSERMWVCVSEDFNVKTLVKKILQCLTRNKVGNLELEQLQTQLREKLEGKKYLLVLDDVWNENRESWDNLENYLHFGAQGSKILVTTRSRKVALIMGVDSKSLYELKGLTDDESWDLFKQVAFGGDEEKASSSMLFKVVTTRCKGVPLAIKTLASAVLSHPAETYWLSRMEKDEVWSLPLTQGHENSIIPVLKLSYNHLPSHLRQCFAYCSLFPKDEEIPKELLIRLWMAQGYIQSSNEGNDLEEIGYMYLHELLSRSFFEYADEVMVRQDCVRMHDLLHDVAQSISGNDCLCISLDKKQEASERVRHAYVQTQRSTANEIISNLKLFSKVKTNLRTLLLYGRTELDEEWIEEIRSNIFSDFKYLRVLNLGFGRPAAKLPSSIGKLKHLRFLRLSGFQFKTLPDTVCNLLNLQTLGLYTCYNLEELPKDLWKLVNLRYLVLATCGSLRSLPDCLHHLSSIRTLEIIGCKKLWERCRKKIGPDWWKIQHIPNIFIDLERNAYGEPSDSD